jgi:methionyl-tRNA formyltransferase
MAGDTETGVTIMKMDQGLDTGPMCRIGRIAITPGMTAGVLHDALAELGAKLIVETLAEFPPHCVGQPEGGVTYAKKIDKAETRIEFSCDAVRVRNHIHGLSPFPGAWCMVAGARVKVLHCEVVEGSGAAGTVLDDGLRIACGAGAVRLLKVKREGKGPMAAEAFLRGFAVKAGMVLSG